MSPCNAKLFPEGFNPVQVLDEIHDEVERLQHLFFEWCVSLRRRWGSIGGQWGGEIQTLARRRTESESQRPGWPGCKYCGADDGEIADRQEDGYLWCGACQRPCFVFRVLEHSDMHNLHRPRAERIVDLTSRFEKLLAGLGFYRQTDARAITGFGHGCIGVTPMQLQSPLVLPTKFRPCRTTSWSLVRRLANRISELSAAKARVEGWRSATAFVTIAVSREEFEQGRLSELKISRQISDSSHVQHGPMDATFEFWTDGGAVDADRVAWPLTYWFYSLAAQALPVARAPCKHCGLVLYSDQDVRQHEFGHNEYGYADS